MISNNPNLFGRIITAMVTPFDDELNVDYKALEKIIIHLANTGTDALVVSGTTGESPTLSDNEKLELLKASKSFSNNKLKMIMGVGSNDTAKTIKASKEAEKYGADGLLVVAPYYNKPNQDGLIAHFTAVANSTSLPIIIYNIPGRTGINIAPETIIELANKCENIHALKDSTGSTDQAADIARVNLNHNNFYIYSGDDYLTLPFLSVGAGGVISVASHIVGNAIKDMTNYYLNGKIDEARKLHYKYLPLFKALFIAPNPTCVKYALSQLGLCKAHLRLPLAPINKAHAKVIDENLQELKINSRSIDTQTLAGEATSAK